VIRKSSPFIPTAEKIIEYKQCEWCETVTVSLDAIAKFSTDDEKKLKEKLYESWLSSNDLIEVKEVVKGLSQNSFSNVPFWYRVRVTDPSQLKNYLKNSIGINEVHFTSSYYNIWIRGSYNSTEELDRFESDLWSGFGHLILDDETHIVFKRFQRKT
jgi:hypothetical protein